MGSFLKTRLPLLCMESHTMLTVHENLLYLMEICWLPSLNICKSSQTSCIYCFLFVKWRKCPTFLWSYTTLLPCYLAERWGRGTEQICPFKISVRSQTSQENKHYSRQNIWKQCLEMFVLCVFLLLRIIVNIKAHTLE